MTSITAQTHATLDGVIDAPPAEALLPYMSHAGRQGALDLALAADALLLARETWQGLARAWREQTGPMAEGLNAMPKYVVSATLGSADEWDHTTIVALRRHRRPARARAAADLRLRAPRTGAAGRRAARRARAVAHARAIRQGAMLWLRWKTLSGS
jgi:hypothetical protein